MGTEEASQAIGPARKKDIIRIQKCHYRGQSQLNAAITGYIAVPLLREAYIPKPFVGNRFDDVTRSIGRGIVDDNHLEVVMAVYENTMDRPPHGVGAVERRNYNGDLGHWQSAPRLLA
jgi:hypothetical protein